MPEIHFSFTEESIAANDRSNLRNCWDLSEASYYASSPRMLSIDGLSKSYGAQILFDAVSLQVHPRERIGLVGRNGSGKTTLFRMILGEFPADDGSIVLPKNYRLGHVAQHLNFTKSTILDEGCLGLRPEEVDDTYKVEKILFGLGFTKGDLSRPPEEFSGGFQVRLNLAKVLISNPNLLLLDEPTNYLDIVSIRWIIGFLRGWKHELMLISHDREFMDSITTHTACIHRQKVRKIPGGTEKLYTQIEQDETVYENTRQNEDRQRKHMEKFVERFGAKASKAASAQSKQKMIDKLPKRDALSKISELGFRFQYKPIQSKRLMNIEGLTFGYVPDQTLIEDLGITVGPRDRIAIIGKNGKGKSTLIRLLADELEPSNGSVQTHDLVSLGYFAQTNIDKLSDSMTVEEEVYSASPGMERTRVRGICGSMMFGGSLAEKKIQVLSGGERSRVMLAKIIAAPSNILLLDEPTNHLDMQSIEALITALKDYEGAIIFVTHSEMLLKSVANRLIVFQDGKVTRYDDSYDNFLEKVGWGDAAETRSSKETPNSKKELRRQRAQIMTERNKVIGPLKREIKLLETKIFELESEKASMDKRMEVASHEQNVDEIVQLSIDVKRVMNEIDVCYARFEIVDAEYESLSKDFEMKSEK